MLASIFRVLFGFVLACLAAGLTKVMFAIGPQEVLSGDPDKIATVFDWTAKIATHSAVFAAPFAFLAATISEWQGIRGVLFHTFAGIAIAMAGFAVQFLGEAPGAGSILNSYAVSAYAATGLVAGFVYWMFAGRRAGPDFDIYEPAPAVITSTTVPSVPRPPASPAPSKS